MQENAEPRRDEHRLPNFETFSRRMLSQGDGPCITIHKRGTISLNRPSFQALEAPAAVELLYDRDASMIGLRRVDPRAADCYHVRSTARGGGGGPWVISAMAFTRYYRIDVSTSLRYPAQLEDGVLCIDISVAGQSVSPGRPTGSR